MGIKTKLHASYWQMINTKSQKLPLTSGKIPPNGKWQIHTKSFGFIMVRTLFYRTLFLPFSQWKGGKERTELQSVMGIQRQGHLLHNYLFLVLTILGQKNRPPLPLCCLFSSIFSGYSMLSFSCASDPQRPCLKFLPSHSYLMSWFDSQISSPIFFFSGTKHFPSSLVTFPWVVPLASLYNFTPESNLPFLYHSSHCGFEKGRLLRKVCGHTERS